MAERAWVATRVAEPRASEDCIYAINDLGAWGYLVFKAAQVDSYTPNVKNTIGG